MTFAVAPSTRSHTPSIRGFRRGRERSPRPTPQLGHDPLSTDLVRGRIQAGTDSPPPLAPDTTHPQNSRPADSERADTHRPADAREPTAAAPGHPGQPLPTTAGATHQPVRQWPQKTGTSLPRSPGNASPGHAETLAPANRFRATRPHRGRAPYAPSPQRGAGRQPPPRRCPREDPRRAKPSWRVLMKTRTRSVRVYIRTARRS